jgi:glycosyltransferase involved in cell wall biosynthesis
MTVATQMNTEEETSHVANQRGDVRPHRVVHLVLGLNFGGLEKVVYDLARFADRERFSPQVLCLGEIGPLGAAFESAGVPVESLGIHGTGAVRSIRAATRRLREWKPDILHTHNAAPHIVGALAAKLSGVPVVVQTRHGMHDMTGWKNKMGNRLATWLTHRMVAVSSSTAQVARTVDRIPDARLEIIRNGVDLDMYLKRSAAPRAHACKAIHAARLDHTTKDQRTLLRAVRLVVDREPGFKLDLVGDGPDRAVLEALCDELHLRSHVTFLGFRHDIHELLPLADLFVLSSVTEGLPMTLLEAMAASLPVVSTDVGGISELVIRNETGLLVAPQAPEVLAGAILELLHDPQRAEGMGQAGRRRVEEKFDIRLVTARYEQLYTTLLQERSR